ADGESHADVELEPFHVLDILYDAFRDANQYPDTVVLVDPVAFVHELALAQHDAVDDAHAKSEPDPVALHNPAWSSGLHVRRPRGWRLLHRSGRRRATLRPLVVCVRVGHPHAEAPGGGRHFV